MKRKRYDREFKLEAVRLLKLHAQPVAELARELGVPRNRLYKWKPPKFAPKAMQKPVPGCRCSSIQCLS